MTHFKVYEDIGGAPCRGIPPAIKQNETTVADARLGAESGREQALTIRQGGDMGRASVIEVLALKECATVCGHAVRERQGNLVA